VDRGEEEKIHEFMHITDGGYLVDNCSVSPRTVTHMLITCDGSDRTPIALCITSRLSRSCSAFFSSVSANKKKHGTNGGRTPLHLASQVGRLVIVELLLDRGTDANAQNDSGQTALHLASREGHRDVVQFLHLSGV
jgi:Ankyrin repeats (3 copies)